MLRLLLYLLLCLPLCLLMAPDSMPPDRPPVRGPLQVVQDHGGPLPDEATMTSLAGSDPIVFLRWCLVRYDREVTGYRLNFRKRERIGGTLSPVEDINVAFREKPFSVLFTYESEPRPARRVLYVKPVDFPKGKGRLEVQPAERIASLLTLSFDPDGKKARQSSRYPMYEFGIQIGSQRTFDAWVAAQRNDALHIAYLGERKVKELGDRPCWVLRRFPYAVPEEDGIADLTIYVDKETWLQTGSVLKDTKGNLIGEYWFRDVQLNPVFDDDTFTRKALKK